MRREDREDDDRPRRPGDRPRLKKKFRKRDEPSNKGLIIGIIAIVGVGVLAVAGVLAYAYWPSGKPADNQMAQGQQNPAPPPNRSNYPPGRDRIPSVPAEDNKPPMQPMEPATPPTNPPVDPNANRPSGGIPPGAANNPQAGLPNAPNNNPPPMNPPPMENPPPMNNPPPATPPEEAADTGTPVEGFEIGNIAPNISGKDTDGKAFKLTDYRGKVVVLDFWGHW